MSEYTVGVEEEYQLIDPATGELMSSGRAVLDTDWSGDIRQELQESTIEVGTHVCASGSAALADLLRLRLQAATVAAAEDLEIVAAGLHPFSDWRGHQRTAGRRYDAMAETYGRLARDEHIFGMHVHVAVPAHAERSLLLNRLRRYVPHLLALSCSSPWFEGEDTGYASYRMVLWRRWPGSGVPPRLGSDAEYRRYADTLLRAGVLEDERSLYWLMRLHPLYPTIEFRMFDVCPLVADAAALAGFTRTLCTAAAQGLLEERRIDGLSDAALDTMLADDVWRAARYGLDARLVAPDEPAGYETVRSAIGRLLELIHPVAGSLGEQDALHGIERIVQRGCAADRIRALLADGETDMRGLLQWLAAETLADVEMEPLHGGRGTSREQWRGGSAATE